MRRLGMEGIELPRGYSIRRTMFVLATLVLQAVHQRQSCLVGRHCEYFVVAVVVGHLPEPSHESEQNSPGSRGKC